MGRIKYNRKKTKMIRNIIIMIKTFDEWFNTNFSWVFTNGQKYSECELKKGNFLADEWLTKNN